MRSRLLSILLIGLSFSSFGQKPERIELINADVSEFDQELNAAATRLLGNVIFRHQNATMYCDSAYLYRDENRLEAFNNIRIKQGDSLTLTGNRLNYFGNTRVAQVFDSVVMTDRKMTLTTSRLDYDMNKDIAFYTDSGHIVDRENVLTSRLGYYHSNTHDLFFRKDVLLVNPKYTMNCDTLRYNTTEQIAYFLGPTFIHSSDNTIYCEDGWYNTETQKSNFREHSYLQTREQRLKGDSVLYDRTTGIGKVFGNVSIIDTVNDIKIDGDYGEYHELSDSSWVTGHALMTQVFEGDSLFLHGDTLMAIGTPVKDSATTNEKKNLYAFHSVRLYKNDLQGVCDSLVYDRSDSTIRLYYLPVLWSGLNQLTADSISMQTANSEITHIHLVNNAFISALADSDTTVSPDSTRYNQIRGKTMTGYLSKNQLHRVDVNGNGQTIYYAKNSKQKNFAVNRAECSDLIIYIEESKVKSISLLNEPDGTLFPIRQLSTNELRLKGFSWFGKQEAQNERRNFQRMMKTAKDNQPEQNRMRIDKWLWTVRQYKTRSLATEACEKGRILILDIPVKPSRLIKEGEEIHIKRTGLTRKLKVLKLSMNRLNAKVVSEYYADLTPQSEIDAYKARLTRVTIYREPGTGRPTKRDRRTLDDFFENI